MTQSPMEHSQIPHALERWSGLLGAAHVLADESGLQPYLRNVSGLTRRIPAVLRPSNTEEVRQSVIIANEHRIPLHPFGAGGNWGLGSKLPVSDDTVLMDLSRMNKIHEVSVENCYAVIDPGVTQGQLYDYIETHRLPLVLNVTGSGRETSLIGNSLERGIGYFSSRADSLSGLEVVLGSGEVIRTGFGHQMESPLTYGYRHGIGPDLTGLFAQSNFGIVTRAGIELMPRPDAHASVVVKIKDPSLFVPFFDALVDLRRRGIMRTIWHVGNKSRSEIALAPLIYDQLLKQGISSPPDLVRRQVVQMINREGFGPWSAVGGVMGTPRLLRETKREIKSALKGIAEVQFLNDQKIATAKRVLSAVSWLASARRKRIMLEAIEPLYGMSKGIPSDAALKSVYWPTGEDTTGHIRDPDSGHSGMLYVLPFFSLSGESAKEVVDAAEQVFQQHGFIPYITINFVGDRAAEAVINLAFDRRDDDRVNAAHRAVHELTNTYLRMGYPPYRVGIQQMGQIVDSQNLHWKVVSRIKESLDPGGIISPGRYSI